MDDDIDNNPGASGARPREDAEFDGDLEPLDEAPYADARAHGVPRELIRFWAKHGVDPALVTVSAAYRYFREVGATLPAEVRAELPAAEPVEWLPRFWRMPATIGLSRTQLYQNARVCGVDVASGAAVMRVMAPIAGEVRRAWNECCGGRLTSPPSTAWICAVRPVSSCSC